ncbi:hypothetical protein FOCC_FOCC007485 [Frankliniella occidentalis]|nr:hypothetical protein FOCC_FOCC007485 [Frankliniella occidentalis]
MAPPPPVEADEDVEPSALGPCRICRKDMNEADSVQLGAKAFDNVKETSMNKFKDGLWKELVGFSAVNPLRLHRACRQKYIKPSTRDSPFVPLTLAEESRPSLRSEGDFDPKRHCLLCGSRASEDSGKKGKKSGRAVVHRVETATNFERNIRAECVRRLRNGKSDAWGYLVQRRIDQIAMDFPAAEVRYHQGCSVNFRKGRLASGASAAGCKGRKVGVADVQKQANFSKLCTFIDDSDECQFAMSDLYQAMEERAAGGAVYSKKHLRTMLKSHYGGSVHVSCAGEHQIFNFTGFMDSLLHDSWYRNRQGRDRDEKLRIIKLAANIILEDLRKPVYNMKTYPTIEEMISSPLPPTLACLLDTMVTSKSKSQDKIKKKRMFLGQALLFACRPKSYIPPALLALSTDLHRSFGSKVLVRKVKSAGFGVGYKEVSRFVYNLTESAAEGEADNTNAGARHVQYIFDNVDWNKHCLTGRGSVHVLGGLRVTTPAPPAPTVGVPRRELPPSVVQTLTYSEYGIKVVEYKKPQLNGLDLVKVKPLEPADLSEAAGVADMLDALWLAGRWVGVKRGPSWNGYMKSAMRSCPGAFQSAIEALPFVNDQPTHFSTLYSALLFAADNCKKHGCQQCFVTFDQPLFSKAAEIVASDTSGKLNGVVVRLGGFHLLMSFLGAMGHFMEGSGIEDLWGTVYGHNTVTHMMSGKEYARVMRAHSLTQEAIGALLLDKVHMDNHTKAKIRRLHQDLLTQPDAKPSVVADNDIVRDLCTSLERAGEEAAAQSNTARLWWQHFKLVGLVRRYVRAERVGDWELHLECVREMLPYFHAAGHIHYAKAAHLYVQQMEELQGRCADAAREGLFTVHRKPDHWTGVWTDMVIEQGLMRLIKTSGGLPGRGFTESVILEWVLSAPAVLEVSAAVEELTGVYRESSEQHVELRDSRVDRDTRHLQKFTDWLREHSPFAVQEHPLKVMCVSTGKLGADEVNCYKAKEVGLGLMRQMYGQNFGHATAKKKGIVVPLSYSGPVKKKKLSAEEINSNLLFMRMCRVGVTPEKLKEYLKHELASKPPALFDEKGLMRHNDKSSLARRLQCPDDDDDDYNLDDLDISPTELPGTSPGGPGPEEHVVVDGGHLLHTVAWPRPPPGARRDQVVTYRDVCATYVRHCTTVLAPPAPPSRVTIVFDGYEVRWNTKCEEQQRRAEGRVKVCPDISVDDEKEVTHVREDFLSNKANKTCLIRLLKQHLRAAGFNVKQADADADVMIAEEALLKDDASRTVRVVAKDTDIVAVLVARCANNSKITVKSPGAGVSRVYNIGAIRHHLGEVMVECVLLAHAFTGCDTTSAIHRKGKVKLWDALKKHEELRKAAIAFNNPNANEDEIALCGEKLLIALYTRSKDSDQPPAPTLDTLRYYEYYYKVTHAESPMSVVLLSDLPPTSDGARQHSLRAYLTVQEWLGNALDPTRWGWYRGDRSLHPVPARLPPAPQELLTLIACNCKTGCREGSGCSCRKADLPCTPACGKCRGDRCSNTEEGDEAEWNNF